MTNTLSIADFDYLHFGEPYLLNHPLVTRQKTPNITKQRIDIPPLGQPETVHLNLKSSLSFTSLSLAESVKFVDTKIAVQVRVSPCDLAVFP